MSESSSEYSIKNNSNFSIEYFILYTYSFQENKLLSDSRLTERVKLWSYMLKPVDHETVKIDFLRKVNRRNPPFRQKVMTPGRPRMKVKLLQIETLIIVLTFF